jgi:hypothetical protein
MVFMGPNQKLSSLAMDILDQIVGTASYSAPGLLAEAAHRTGRAKADFELREISREEYEQISRLLQL